MHLVGEYSKVGEKRLIDILKYCEKVKMPLAIENLKSNEIFIEVFKNIKSEMLKFCFDSGHQNAFSKDYNFLKKYNDKLIALHLHDNNGQKDEHKLTKFGETINWQEIAKLLVNHPNISLDYELPQDNKYDISPQEFLNETKKQADLLENMILNYENE